MHRYTTPKFMEQSGVYVLDELNPDAPSALEKLEQIHFCILENIERHDNGIHADAELLAQALMLVEDVREEHFNREKI